MKYTHSHTCTMTLCTYMCYYLAHCYHHGIYYKRTWFKSNMVHGGLVMHKVLVTHESCMSLILTLQNQLSYMIRQQYWKLIPSFTKLASIPHALLQLPQSCSSWDWEWLPDSHMASWCLECMSNAQNFGNKGNSFTIEVHFDCGSIMVSGKLLTFS